MAILVAAASLESCEVVRGTYNGTSPVTPTQGTSCSRLLLHQQLDLLSFVSSSFNSLIVEPVNR